MAPMLYSARLESQTDEQWRRRTVLADSAGEARKLMERREDNRAAYSITARRSLRQIETRRHADGVHALVNLDPFATPEGAAEVSGRELLSATGTYVAGGLTLGSKASTYDTATDQVRLDGADFSATGTTTTARRAVVWNDTAGASTTDPVIGWVDFGADVSTTNGTFSIVWDATGIVVYDVT
jgi:hypothetical protein